MELEKMKMRFIATLATVVSLFPAMAFAAGTRNYDEANPSAAMSIAESKLAVEIREAGDPGSSIRVYVRPRDRTCMGVPPVESARWMNSTISGVLNAVSPEVGFVATLIASPVLNANPLCSNSDWGYFTVPVIREGTVRYRVNTSKGYRVDVTFGPDSNGRTVVRRLFVDSW
jgi:hypothetical protein